MVFSFGIVARIAWRVVSLSRSD